MSDVVDPLTELSRALSVARPLARAMRMEATEQARLAFQVESAIERAVEALTRTNPKSQPSCPQVPRERED